MAASPLISKFAHRANEDGTFDSVCRECFVTVATARCESDLTEREKVHVCDQWMRERFASVQRDHAA